MKKLLLMLIISLSGLWAKSQIIFRVLNPLYQIDSYIIVNDNRDSALKYVKGITDTTTTISDFSNIRGVVFVNPPNPPSLWIPSIPKSVEEFSILNHEIFHLVYFIMGSRGIPLTPSTNEAYAYMISYYTNIIYSTLNSYTLYGK